MPLPTSGWLCALSDSSAADSGRCWSRRTLRTRVRLNGLGTRHSATSENVLHSRSEVRWRSRATRVRQRAFLSRRVSDGSRVHIARSPELVRKGTRPGQRFASMSVAMAVDPATPSPQPRLAGTESPRARPRSRTVRRTQPPVVIARAGNLARLRSGFRRGRASPHRPGRWGSSSIPTRAVAPVDDA